MNYEIIDHGVDHARYFQGCGVAFTEFKHVVTGAGETPLDAIDDALEQIAMSHAGAAIDLIDAIETDDYYSACKASDLSVYRHLVRHGEIEDGDDCPDECELHHYISIRYNL